MEKVVYVVYLDIDSAPFEPDRIRRTAADLVRSLDADRYPDVALQVEDHDATSRWQGPTPASGRRVAAILSAWTECADDVEDLERAVVALSPHVAGFVVTESVPRWRTERTTSVTDTQPGVIVTSLLCRAPVMSRDEFVAHWRDVHQPMSLRIHPQWRYVRNVVSRVLTSGAPEIDAVCEEGFESVDDVLDPQRFFGADVSTATWQDNVRTIRDDIPQFLDPARTTATIMREVRVRSFRR